jgi:hypothetical protein
MAVSRRGYELVRISTEIVKKLETEGSEPVHVIGIERLPDGTLNLWFRRHDCSGRVGYDMTGAPPNASAFTDAR